MFAKVFSQILDSSLSEDWQVRHVFEDLLKLADKDGIVDMTPESIARRTNVPLKIVERALVELEKPDGKSRSPDLEGRRIALLDAHRHWGWRVVNYVKYRESATREMLRMSEAERKRAQRKRFSPTPSLPKNPPQDSEEDRERDMSGVVPAPSGFVPDMSRTSTPALAEAPTEKEFVDYMALHQVPAWYAVDKFLAQQAKGWHSLNDWRAYAQRAAMWYANAGRPLTPEQFHSKPTRRTEAQRDHENTGLKSDITLKKL